MTQLHWDINNISNQTLMTSCVVLVQFLTWWLNCFIFCTYLYFLTVYTTKRWSLFWKYGDDWVAIIMRWKAVASNLNMCTDSGKLKNTIQSVYKPDLWEDKEFQSTYMHNSTMMLHLLWHHRFPHEYVHCYLHIHPQRIVIVNANGQLWMICVLTRISLYSLYQE